MDTSIQPIPKQYKETIIWYRGNVPPKPGRYMITRNDLPKTSFDDWQCRYTNPSGWGFFNPDTIIAWAEMPIGWGNDLNITQE